MNNKLFSFIINIAKQEKISITNLKLQKIMFFIYGVVLAKHNINLVPQGFEAWKYGPVNREAYDILSNYKGDFISLNEVKIDNTANIDETISKTIKIVWDFYKDINAFDLVRESHKKGTPWIKVYIPGESIHIEAKDVEKYYKDNLTMLENMYTSQDNMLYKFQIRANSIIDEFEDTLEYLKNT